MASGKFGSLFDNLFGSGFKTRMEASARDIESTAASLEIFVEALDKTQESLRDTKDNLKDATKAWERELDTAEKRRLEIIKKGFEDEEEVLKDQIRDIKRQKKIADKVDKAEQQEKDNINKKSVAKFSQSTHSISNAVSTFTSKSKELEQQLRDEVIGAEEYAEAMKAANLQKFSDGLQGVFDDTSKAAVEAGSWIGNEMGDKIGDALVPLMGPLGKVVGEVLGKAIFASFKQVVELNSELIKLQRATGGLVTSMKLGYDSFGNATKGMTSLKTATINANISIDQFSSAIGELFGSGGFGQVIGVVDDLDNSAAALQNYGIQAARIEKLYGGKIGPAVSSLFKNFGVGIQEATDMVVDATEAAAAYGLNVGEFTKNLGDAAALAGQLYFKTNQELVKMAGIATQLGTTVDSVAKGINQMKGVTDLFKKQQESAALGLHNVAKSMSEVYALRQTGQSAKASQVELKAFTKDLSQQGFIDKNQNVTQQGIATLEASGATQEQIQSLQKMGRDAEAAGIALERAFDPDNLSKAEKARLAAVQKGNMTMQEQLNQMTGKLKQAFIDPLAKVFGPVMDMLLDLTGIVVDLLMPALLIVGDAFDLLMTPIKVLAQQISAIAHDIFDPVKEGFEKIQKSISGFIGMFKSISEFLIKLLITPIRILGKIFGGFIQIITNVVGIILDTFAPIVEYMTSLFGDGSKGLDGFIEGVGEAVDFMVDVFTGIIEVILWPFKALGFVLGLIIDAFEWMGEVITDYFIKPIKEMFEPVMQGVVDVLEPFITAWDQLTQAFRDFVDWVYSMLPGSRDSQASIQDGYLQQEMQNIASTDAFTRNTNPNAVTEYQKSQASDSQKANEEALAKTFMAQPIINVSNSSDALGNLKTNITY